MTLKRGKTLLDDALSALKRKKALLQMNNLLCECSVLSLRIRGSSRGEIPDVTRSSSRLRLMYRTSIHPSILGLCLLSAVQYILCFLSARRLPARRPFRSHQATVSPGGKKNRTSSEKVLFVLQDEKHSVDPSEAGEDRRSYDARCTRSGAEVEISASSSDPSVIEEMVKCRRKVRTTQEEEEKPVLCEELNGDGALHSEPHARGGWSHPTK